MAAKVALNENRRARLDQLLLLLRLSSGQHHQAAAAGLHGVLLRLLLQQRAGRRWGLLKKGILR